MKTKRDIELAYSWDSFEIAHTNDGGGVRAITLNRTEAIKLTALLSTALANDMARIVLDSLKKARK